jgi:nucleotide-binding universal stress UspA family protein
MQNVGLWERVLVPIDTTRCPLEVFGVLNRFGRKHEVTAILLHVIGLRVAAPENRVYDELVQEARWYLQRLADQHIDRSASTLIRVRIGNPAEEILAEAKAEGVTLILLTSHGPSCRTRLKLLWKPVSGAVLSSSAGKLIREAPCDVFVLPAKTRFNCERVWGRPTDNALQRSAVPCPSNRPPSSVTCLST